MPDPPIPPVVPPVVPPPAAPPSDPAPPSEPPKKPPASAPPKNPAEPAKPSNTIDRFAAKLKAELGDKYSTKFDAMETEIRIAAMEATLDALSVKPGEPKKEPLKKGETKTPLGPPAEVKKPPMTTMQRQKAAGYKDNLRKAGSHRGKAQKIYAKLNK